MPEPIHIMAPGKHTAASGDEIDFNEAVLQASAAAYDPNIHEAPIVIGHPKDNAPAYGWVNALAYAEDGLHANPAQVDAEFEELVKAGRFKKVSASFYLPDSPINPVPGTYYLRHVGFLGAQPPAVKGLKPASFAEDQQHYIELADAWTLTTTASLFRRLREWMIGKFGIEEADKVVASYAVEDLEASARTALDTPPEPKQAGFTETHSNQPGDPDTMKPEEIQAAQAKLKAEQDALAQQKAEFEERAAAIAKREAASRLADITVFVDGLIADGKFAPGRKAEMIAFMDALDDDKTIEFGEGDAQTKTTAGAMFRKMMADAPKIIDFGERGSTAGTGDDRLTAKQIAQKAIEYQEQQAAAGIRVSTSAAVRHVLGK